MEPHEMGTMTHESARSALQAAADGRLSAGQRRMLDQHLAGCAECRAYQASLAAFEARLAGSLQSRWPARDSAAPELATLRGRIQTRTRRQIMLKSVVRTLAWASLAVLFVVFLAWSIRTSVPDFASFGATVTEVAPSLTSTEKDSDTTGVPQVGTPSPAQATQEGDARPPGFQEGAVSIFPELEFTFNVSPPDGPQRVRLFEQILPEALSAENARQAAANLGIMGEASAASSESPDMSVYEVSDGYDLARFMSFPQQFVLNRATGIGSSGAGSAPAPDDLRISSAEALLNQYGLLNLPYRAGINLRGDVEFTPLLDERPLIFGIGDTSGSIGWARANVNAYGQVSALYYSGREFRDMGEYPILSASQAWERLSASKELNRARYAVLGSPGATETHEWPRAYPSGQVLDLYGYLRVFGEGDGEGQVWFNNWPVANEAALSGANSGEFLHLRGQFSEADGRRVLNVESWELSTLEEQYLSGKLQRQGEQAFLFNDDGRVFLLPDFPPELPDGTRLTLNGAARPGDPVTLEWRLLTSGQLQNTYGISMSCWGGGGGGGGDQENANFGGGRLAELNLGGQAQLTPTPPQGGLLQVGQALEGVEGQLYLYQRPAAGGKFTYEGTLWVEHLTLDGVATSEGMLFNLEGPGLESGPPYQNLPVKLWGQVERFKDGNPVLTVERVEELYPGLRIQVWAGDTEEIDLEGQKALLLTTQAGEQYLLKHSIGCGAACKIGPQGRGVLYEGYVIPGETFGGYPLLVELNAGLLNEQQDLSAYQMVSTQISIWNVLGDNPRENLENLRGQVAIEKVELAYLGISLDHCANNEPGTQAGLEPWLYLQPIWVFSGHFDDGRAFLVQVQALPDEYLK